MFLGASQGASQAKSTRNNPKTLGINGNLLVTNEEFERKMGKTGLANGINPVAGR